jgi:predicted lipid-binding transport protein (Tim44 family)
VLRRQALGSTGGAVRSAAAPKIARNDLDAFERLLGDMQTAFSRRDIDELGAMTTPEMLS